MPTQACPFCAAFIDPVATPGGWLCPRCGNKGQAARGEAPGAPSYVPPGPMGGGPPPYIVARPQADGALVAMIFGILSVTILGPLGIAAVVMGNKAQRAIEASGGYLDGAGYAKAGVILGWIGIAMTAFGVLMFLLVFGLVSRVAMA